MEPHRFPRLSAPLLAVLFLPACASLRERLTPRSPAVIQIIQQIDAYHGGRRPTLRDLGASGPVTIIRYQRPPTCGSRIDGIHTLQSVYPKGPPDKYSMQVIDALIAGKEPPPPPKVTGDPADMRMLSCAVVTNSGRVIHRRDFERLKP